MLVVHTRDEKGKPQQFRAGPMDDAEAEAERQRIQDEHAAAGDDNRWITFGTHSVQSRFIHAISLELPPRASAVISPDLPRFRRDQDF